MANALIGLIKGQTIRIDNHHRGVQSVWDDKYDIHLHKRPNNKNVDYHIKIKLNREQGECVLSSLPAKIRKEIIKVTNPKNREELNKFCDSVYKYITENFSWNGDEDVEKRLINNIEKAFGVQSDKPQMRVVNGKTQKHNVIQMMHSDDSTRFHVSFNYSKKCVYIGQFQLGSMNGIKISAQKQWAEVLERNLPDILRASDTKAALERIRISGVSYKVIDSTLDAIERIYGDEPDPADEKDR